MEERLLACGFTAQMASDIVAIFGDDRDGLSEYVATVEYLYVSAV